MKPLLRVRSLQEAVILGASKGVVTEAGGERQVSHPGAASALQSGGGKGSGSRRQSLGSKNDTVLGDTGESRGGGAVGAVSRGLLVPVAHGHIPFLAQES